MDFAAQVERCDRAAIANLGDNAVTYAPAVGSPVEVQGLFEEDYARVDLGEAGVSSVGPAVFLRVADLPADPKTDSPTLTINGKTYRPHEVQPDSLGGVLMLLHRVL